MPCSSDYMFSKRNGLQWITGAKFPTYNWDWGNRLTKQRQNSPGRIWMQLGWIHARRYGHMHATYSRDFLCQWHIYNSVIGSTCASEKKHKFAVWNLDGRGGCACDLCASEWRCEMIAMACWQTSSLPIRGLEKAAFERWPKTSLVGQLRESAKWWQNWRGLRFHRSLQFGAGNPPANSLMVSVGSVGYGYGKDIVSDVAGARIRPCWCQVCTAPWAVKLAQILCPRVLFLVIRSGMTVLGQYFVATSGWLWYGLQLRW